MPASAKSAYVEIRIDVQRYGTDDLSVPKPKPRPFRTLICEPSKFNPDNKYERKFAILEDIRKILLYKKDTDTDDPWVKPKEIYQCLRDKYGAYYKDDVSFTAAIRCFVQERCYVKDCQHESKRWSGQSSRRRDKVRCYETPWILSQGQSRKGWRYLRSDERV